MLTDVFSKVHYRSSSSSFAGSSAATNYTPTTTGDAAHPRRVIDRRGGSSADIGGRRLPFFSSSVIIFPERRRRRRDRRRAAASRRRKRPSGEASKRSCFSRRRRRCRDNRRHGRRGVADFLSLLFSFRLSLSDVNKTSSCEAQKRERRERDEKTKERSESQTFTFSLQNWFSRTLSKWMEKIRVFAFSTHKIKKKENTHTHQKGKILSIPATSKVYIYARVKKTAYIKNGFYCALFEKSYISVSHFLVRCERIERSRVFARGGFPIGFFLLPVSLSLSFSRRDGLELFSLRLARGSC